MTATRDYRARADTWCMNNLPPEGWFPDPADRSLQRFWNGAAWTKEMRPASALPAQAPPSAVPASVPAVTPAAATQRPIGTATAAKTGTEGRRFGPMFQRSFVEQKMAKWNMLLIVGLILGEFSIQSMIATSYYENGNQRHSADLVVALLLVVVSVIGFIGLWMCHNTVRQAFANDDVRLASIAVRTRLIGALLLGLTMAVAFLYFVASEGNWTLSGMLGLGIGVAYLRGAFKERRLYRAAVTGN